MGRSRSKKRIPSIKRSNGVSQNGGTAMPCPEVYIPPVDTIHSQDQLDVLIENDKEDKKRGEDILKRLKSYGFSMWDCVIYKGASVMIMDIQDGYAQVEFRGQFFKVKLSEISKSV